MNPRGTADLDTLISQAAGLRRLAVRLVGESDADDVVQDAVVAGMGSAPADPRALRPWLVHVVRNFAAGRRRGDARRRAREADTARREALPSAGDMVERMEVQRVVAEEVLRLDDPYRATVLALHFEGHSAEDYARSRGVPSATVRSWSKRGLDQLRARLDRRFGGDRAAWSACLLPLARPEAALVPLAIGGGLLMKKLAVAAAAVLVAGLAWWTFADGAGRDELDTDATASAPEVVEPISTPAIEPPDATVPAAPAEIAARRVDESAQPAAPVAAGGRVTGRITWSPDGAPAVDVGVRLHPVLGNDPWTSPPQVLTDRDGRFAFEDVAPDTYGARLDRSTVSKVFRLEAGGAYELELSIARAEDVVGRVLDADGVPVPGAEVFVRESNSSWARRIALAGADGGFRFEGADRWAAFFARAPGHAPSGMRQSVDGPPRTMDLYLGGAPGRISGLVLDARGEPRAGALVVVDPQGATSRDAGGNLLMRCAARELRTDATGRFEVLDADVGPNTVRVVVPGLPYLDATVVVRPGLSSETVFRLPAVARVRGRVTDAEGRAVEGARIEAQTLGLHAWTSVATGPDGRFDTGCVAAGRVRLSANHKGGPSAALDTTLTPGADFDWSPTIGALLDVRGRLVDLAGAPLAGRTVTLSVKKRKATTDDDGRFVFDALKPQEYSVMFDDGELSARTATVVPGGPEIVMVAERANARIVGRVVGSDGRGLPGIRVECDRAQATTGPDGTFEFVNVRSGACEVTARLPRMIFFWLATLDVQPGALHDVGDVVVPATGALHVRARSEEGVPIGWASPTLGRVGPRDQWVTLRGWGPDGDWNVEDLPAGEYELGVRDGGAAMQRRLVTIRAGETTEVELDLRFGAQVEVEARVALGSGPFTGIVFEFRDAGGAVIGSRSIRNPWGATSTTEWAVLAPGSYECSARTADGRSGRTRLDVGPDGAASARTELR